MVVNKRRTLGIVTTQKIGDTIALTVPTSTGIAEGQKYLLTMAEDGTLIYHAQADNPWLNGDYRDIDFRAELADVGNYGIERPAGKE